MVLWGYVTHPQNVDGTVGDRPRQSITHAGRLKYYYTAHAHYLVQGEREVRLELLQAGGNISALLATMDARHEEVDEPREAVLVNGLDVGQV